jgi:hypothetical protein
MDTPAFNAIVEEQLQRCIDVLVIKGAEYATEDRLHNFKVAATIQDVDILEAVAGMMAKHTVSVYDMCGSTEPFTLEQWDEKITDHINYLILLRAAVIEQLSEHLEEEPIELTPNEQLAEWLSKYLLPHNSTKKDYKHA